MKLRKCYDTGYTVCNLTSYSTRVSNNWQTVICQVIRLENRDDNNSTITKMYKLENIIQHNDGMCSLEPHFSGILYAIFQLNDRLDSTEQYPQRDENLARISCCNID